jgi:hypothetical protein
MTDRTWEELEQLNESDDYGTSWTPTKDPEHPNPLAGTVRGYERASMEFENGFRPWICKVEDRAGVLWSLWLFGKVLIDEFTTKQPEVGERIVVRYVGPSPNPKPGRQPAQLYRLTVDRELSLATFLQAPGLTRGDEDDEEDDDGAGKTANIPKAPKAPEDGVEVVPDADVVEEPGDDDIPF